MLFVTVIKTTISKDKEQSRQSRKNQINACFFWLLLRYSIQMHWKMKKFILQNWRKIIFVINHPKMNILLSFIHPLATFHSSKPVRLFLSFRIIPLSFEEESRHTAHTGLKQHRFSLLIYPFKIYGSLCPICVVVYYMVFTV